MKRVQHIFKMSTLLYKKIMQYMCQTEILFLTNTSNKYENLRFLCLLLPFLFLLARWLQIEVGISTERLTGLNTVLAGGLSDRLRLSLLPG